MKHLWCTLVVAVLLSHSPAQAQSKADEAAVRAVPQAWSAAWAKHDGHQLAKLMADDVDFVTVGDDWLQGKANFELYHTRLLAGRQKDSTFTPDEIAARFLRPDLAVLHWSWKIQGGLNPDQTPRTPRVGLFTMILEKKAGAWLIVAAQNGTRTPAPPNPDLEGIKPPISFPVEESH
jgi:uncharacterized protein (TIGR02246 family)